jgi:hypothetical protein
MSEYTTGHVPHRLDHIIPATSGLEYVNEHQRPVSSESEYKPGTLAVLRRLIMVDLPEHVTVDTQLQTSIDPYVPVHLRSREISSGF